jgi:hypothetical protein
MAGGCRSPALDLPLFLNIPLPARLGIFAMRYRAFDVRTFHAGGNEVHALSLQTGFSAILTFHQVDLLIRCRLFKTLDEHAQEISSVTNIDYSFVRSTLQKYADIGLLTSEKNIRRTLGRLKRNDSNSQSIISSVAFTAYERPASLKQALESYILKSKEFGRNLRFLVVDDSRTSDAQEQNERNVKVLSRQYGVCINILNRQVRKTIAETVSKLACIPPEVTLFGLLGYPFEINTTGGTVNTALMATTNEMLVLTDDDTYCTVGRPVDAINELAFVSNRAPSEFRFYKNLYDANQNTLTSDKDFYSIHETLLGQTVANLVSEAANSGTPLNIDSIGENLLRRLLTEGSKVSISHFGAIGDSGIQYNWQLLFLSGDSFARLIQSQYRRNLQTRIHIRAPKSLTISDFDHCWGGHLGLDNQSFLPPFMPVLRNSDGMYAALVKACCPKVVNGYLPYVQLHNPPETRSNDRTAVTRRRLRFRVNDSLIAMIYYFAPYVTGPTGQDRLVNLGCYLTGLAKGPESDFVDTLQQLHLKRLGQLLASANESLLNNFDGPAEWRRDVESIIYLLKQSMLERNTFMPSDLRGTMEDRIAILKSFVLSFGNLLNYWPAMREVAPHLDLSSRQS